MKPVHQYLSELRNNGLSWKSSKDDQNIMKMVLLGEEWEQKQ